MNDQRVEDLLSRLGMPEYIRLFAKHAIDWDVLPDITDADLQTLGLPLGHRRKLLRAIAGNPPRLHPTPPPFRAPPPPPTLMEARAERRQITVMFCDMVGSTALASTLDPEDMLEILKRYQRVCAGHVAEFGGCVAQYLGDGILAYFGYPQAHEDDAERAVRAGLAIVDSIGPLNRSLNRRQRVAVAVRVGIATGLVVVGNIIGDAGAEERTAIGETPNLSARLQSIALPDTVVIADATRRVLGAGFEYQDLGPQKLSGFVKPERAWQVVRPIDGRSRFEARRTPLLPFVGREAELRLLSDRWGRAYCGMGQVVLVCGEPGIGKSRLTLAFEDAITVETHDTIHFCCSNFHRNTTLQPVIERLSRAGELTPEDDPQIRADKLRPLLGGDEQSIELALHMLGALMSKGRGAEPPPTGVSLQRQKDLMLASLVAGIQEAATFRPQLVVFEDLQWIDPTSHEFLEILIDSAAARPILLLATCRPEFAAPWRNLSHVTTVTLGRLNRRRTEDFVRAILEGKALPEQVFTQIVAKTGGVPLFVEELTKAVLDSGLVRAENDRYVLDGPLPQRAIPATIHDSLMARLDQLAMPKEIAQVGSVIGRRFSFGLLSAVTAMPDSVLLESLDRLVASELVFCRGSPPDSVYHFKHALVQDTAYESLLLSKRRHLHQRIAMVLESALPESTDASPELIAYHYSEAGDAEPAVTHWRAAAEKASGASAYMEALSHLRRGLAVLDNLPEGETRDIRELELQLPTATALLALKGAGAPEVEEVYARALQLCEQLPESPLHFAAFWGWWRISMDFRTGRTRADRLLALAQRLAEPDLLLQAHHCLWATNFMLGDHTACLQHISCGINLYRSDQHPRLASIYGGHDIKVCADGEAALSLWILGHAAEALQRIEAATSWAAELGHAGSIAHALDYAMVLNRYRCRPDQVAQLADEMLHFAEERGLSDYVGKAQLFHGWATAMLDDTDAGLAELTSGLAAQCASGTPEDFPVYYDMLAEAQLIAGRPEKGLLQVEEALAVAERSGIRYWDAELLRRKAALLLTAGEDDGSEAEACLQQALSVAREQGARMLELRAATDLSRLWQRKSRSAAARDLLLPLCDWFGESDAEDLRDARMLAGELA